MKLFQNNLLFIVLFIAGFARAEYIPRDYFYVVSDVESDTVEAGWCVVKGRVTDPFSGEGIKGGLISNLTRSHYAVTDENGNYQIRIPSTDTTIFFYHQQYKEIVCWSYPFKSQHVVTMNFVSSEKLPDGVIQVEEKPVIYLYPEKACDITVKLDPETELTSTYPKYNGAWHVTANPDGTIEANGRTYPYLFWEGKTDDLYLIRGEGKYIGESIHTDTTIQYLENTLAYFGLNDKESTDFITYWAPRMQHFSFAHVQFFVDEDYDTMIGNMVVEPKPDGVRRIYMLFRGFDEMPETLSFRKKVSPLERNGFVVIEWGGTEILGATAP